MSDNEYPAEQERGTRAVLNSQFADLEHFGVTEYVGGMKFKDVHLDPSRMTYMMWYHLDMQIQIAEMKTNIILGTAVLLVASVALQDFSITQALEDGTTQERVQLVSTALFLVTLALCFFFALRASMPSVKAPTYDNKNLFFFGYANHISEKDYMKEYLNLTSQAMKEQVAMQLHARSSIVARKFRNLGLSMRFLILVIVFWLITVLL
ncbi:MAG: Pycsar system effector family protein [Anaerolineales bacterium]